MANSDKLKQIISNLQNLNDLVVGVKDSELYPVSFFSNAFDLIQKLQNGFHTLEADQIEMFTSQMKKHQDLIISIHRQMRNIESISTPRTPLETSKQVTAPEPLRPEIKDYFTPQDVDNDEYKSDNTKVEKPQKVSIFGRIIGKEKVLEPVNTKETVQLVEKETVRPVEKEIIQPLEKETIRPVEKETIRPVEKETVQLVEKETVQLVEKETVQPVEKETLKQVENKKDITPMATPVIIPDKKNTETQPKEETQINVSRQSFSLNDVIEKNKLTDLRKAFNLNDRFRYQRELFGGKEDAMNKVIAELNNQQSLKEALIFLEDNLHWDNSDPTVIDFIKKIEIRFL
ncbi:MAG: hypothetical protein LBT24_03955 [Tannerella sp.]|jgi:hypothetical protein|nr:hypothetical protein [Tannerella sp.]